MIQKLRILLGGKRFAAVFCLTVFLWVFIPLLSQTATALQHFITDITQRGASAVLSGDPRLAIVEIDTETLQAVPHRWPWPRREMARLIELIASGSPQVLLIDVLFQQPDENDDQLESAIRRAGNVALVSLVEDTRTEEGRSRQRYHSIKRFRSAARYDGFVWAVVDDDGRIRSFVGRDEILGLDSCALQVARSFASSPIALVPDQDETARALLLYGRRDGAIPRVSARKLLSGEASPAMLEGRIVLLGMTAEILHDYHQTALGLTSGVEILGASLDVLLQNRIIRRCTSNSWRIAMACAGLFGAMLALGFITRNAGWWSLGLLLVGAPIAHLLCMVGGIMPPFAPFILSWLLTTVAWAAGTFFVEFMDWQILRAESEASSKIQAAFFPREPWESTSGYRCLGLCHPCSDVGGDYFDYFPQSDGALAFLIADVTGHGFSAAMVGTMAKTMAVHLDKLGTFTPSQWMNATNTVIYTQFKRTHLMTSICGRLDPRTDILELAWCGHLPAYVVNPAGTVAEYGKPSYPLGTRAKTNIQIVTLTLQPGESLILYTDGITEAVDWDNDQFGFPRFKETLARHATLSGRPFADRVLDEVRAHLKGRPFTDDVTILVLSRGTPTAASATTSPVAADSGVVSPVTPPAQNPTSQPPGPPASISSNTSSPAVPIARS